MSQINESALTTPGVYINEIPSFPPSVAQVATAIPAFIGYTHSATDSNGNSLTNIPTKIYSLKDYELYFGTAENETGIAVAVTKTTDSTTHALTSLKAIATNSTPLKNNMYYSIRSFYDNGGGACYIVSVGAATPTLTSADETLLHNGLDAIEAYDEPTLIVFPEGQVMDSNTHYYDLITKAITQCANLQNRFTLVDVYDETVGHTTDTNMTNFRSGFSSNNPNYAAAYYPNLKTNYNYQYQDTGVHVTITTDGSAAAAVTLDTLKATDGATYSACLNAILQLSPTLPPTPAMAGIYAAVDGTRGVWKAPANVVVAGVYDLTDSVTEAEQGGMNIDANTGKSVNAIRAFSGKGILVWGARTLDGNSNDFRYVSVRRLYIMVETSVKKAAFQFVFEPNDGKTWMRIKAMIENYLTELWRQGALAGPKPEQAFYVKVGLGETMTMDDILNGKMIVEIGMAPVRPAEFIILRFSQIQQQA
ncbi:MAG TPA: phage tail sheath C-terminal domain-containing protein [Bacteroidia bacterium]|jgi:phage tail sheath protein FI|nr:phage tail sheath C-terminal domain-containing protein [Bacteroidia bacterium]